MHEFLSVTTALVLGAVLACNVLLTGDASAFVAGLSRGPQLLPARSGSAGLADAGVAQQPLASGHEALGMKGLLCFGMGFGVLLAATRGRVSRQAEGSDIAVKEKAELSKVAYLENVPRSIIEKSTLEKLLAATPREQWENPPEDSYLFVLKQYAEVYGPGKVTKMGWWDFYAMKIDMPGPEDVPSQGDFQSQDIYNKLLMQGRIPLAVPGPAGWWYTGALIQWKGKEPFAGDQVITPVRDSRFSKQFINNTAFYREGLKPWQRGLEIGMAHGYFLIGPFVSLGPLRNTPEAATVGLLCGCVVVGVVSVGGLIFGSTIRPTLFDKEGDEPAAGFVEMINWHALGGVGGAGFAHALITVFGSA